jgi:hypothetical protein
LPANNDDVVVACPNCRQATLITNANSETPISLYPIRYVAPNPNATVTHWLPFWVYTGKVHMQRRETQGGNRRSEQESEAMWGQARRFYVPAWDIALDNIKRIATDLIVHQPTFQPTQPPADALLTSAVVEREDAGKLLDLIVLSIEAERSDYLKNIQYQLQLSDPEMWGMPAKQSGSGWELLPYKK